MENWDDIRFFLEVARSGSIRKAAISLNVNHSTVSRRISQFENRLGSRVFEKLPSGYQLTTAGIEILTLAQEMDEQANTLQRRIFARDTLLSGELRVALPSALATHMIMPDMASFAFKYPNISLQISSSYDTVNLTKRQADVAIRLVYDQHSPPDHLYGMRLGEIYRGVYLSKNLLSRTEEDTSKAATQWIYKEEDPSLPAWAQEHSLALNETAHIVSDLHTQICATEAGLGLSILPCFMGDANPHLARAPNSQTRFYGDLWMLTHGETRHTPRVRVFTNYIKDVFRHHKNLLKGNP